MDWTSWGFLEVLLLIIRGINNQFKAVPIKMEYEQTIGAILKEE
jgi:hypothetical protein